MGDFLPQSSLIIQQHVAQSNIGPVDEFLGQWVEFINAHTLSPVVNFEVFSDVLDSLVKPITTGQLSNEEVRISLCLFFFFECGQLLFILGFHLYLNASSPFPHLLHHTSRAL